MKSKLISGRKFGSDFDETERRKIVKDYLSGQMTKRDIWAKYTGSYEEHGQILNWMRLYGYSETFSDVKKRTIFANMSKNKNQNQSVKDFELEKLRKRVQELEKEVSESRMHAAAYSTMIDIAERELDIKIRKKSVTKPLKP